MFSWKGTGNQINNCIMENLWISKSVLKAQKVINGRFYPFFGGFYGFGRFLYENNLADLGGYPILSRFKITHLYVFWICWLYLDYIGMSRGEVAMRLLLEMNHEVRGDCVQESIEQVPTLFMPIWKKRQPVFSLYTN